MKTPEEIKKGLECCANYAYFCDEECPYCNPSSNGVDCASKMHADALAYIQRLEERLKVAEIDRKELWGKVLKHGR